MSIYLIHNSVLQYTDIGFDWEIGRGKKEKNCATSCYILFLDMHLKYLNNNDYGFI